MLIYVFVDIDRPLRDRLNGAISGAVARNLDRELDYLIPRRFQCYYVYNRYRSFYIGYAGMKDMLGSNFENYWKLLTIQIGSKPFLQLNVSHNSMLINVVMSYPGNDQCASCAQGDVSDYSVEKYGEYLSAAVDRIKQNVPRVIVNICKRYAA